jgi:hypothetical protein
MAGGIKVQMTNQVLENIIRETGREPKKINSGYNYAQDDLVKVL